MKLREKATVRSVRLALGLLATLAASQALSQEQAIQRVEVTGSAIKRIAAEGALPIQVLTQEAIAKSGATNVAELIQALPAMQGFTISDISAGTNSGGRVTASIHDLGESYTLVLLNGRRLAPQGSGSAVNLQAIPMSAVERIEVLTDGASSLYGSDAIAGVVNFILKRNQQGGDITANYSTPTESRAGDSKYVSGSYGFGDLETKGYNVLAAFRHDQQSQMKSTEREFAKTAYIPFDFRGNHYIYDRTSTATIPANVTATFNNNLPSVGFSPYLRKNGNCPEMNFVSLNNTATTQNCAFDFVQTVEVVPENKRDSLFLKGTLKVGDDLQLFTDFAFSRFDITARIAPNTAPFTIATNSAMYTQYVKPYLTVQQQDNVKAVSGNYRTYDWGTRDSRTLTDSTHFVAGAEGNVAGWNMNSALTWSRNKIDEQYVGGYAKDKEFRDMLANRSFDPFAPIGGQTDATKALIAGSLFHGSIREASTTLKVADVRASRELFPLSGGAAQLGVGADYRQYHYEQTPLAKDSDIYNFNASAAYDMKRDTYGVFAELLTPLFKGFELTSALRYDSIGAIENAVANRTMGKKASKSTYKISARYLVTEAVLLRGSFGTGFKAPSMLDIGQPLVNAGFTAGSFTCPITHAEYCRPGKTQYNVLSGGNENLKNETSKQFTVGIRLEPSSTLSVALDLWDVKMRDAVSGISEQQAFADPVKFRDLFTTYTEPSTGNTYWAFKSLSVNIGRTHNRGIDWEAMSRYKFDWGTFTANANGTHMLKSDYTLPGTDDQWTNSVDFFGVNNSVTFRNIARFSGTLETGALSNTLTANYRNGYTDALTSVRNTATNVNESIRLDVPSYITLDWQGRYSVNKAIMIRLGVKNLLDKDPPLSLRASSGHQVGYDPRYASALGRQVYVTGNYKF
jgi:iron complex outermembrane receptor protein